MNAGRGIAGDIEARHALADTPRVDESRATIERILRDPAFLPFKLDLERSRVLLVRLDARQRADAAFLDERALPAGVEGYWLPLQDWLATAGDAPSARIDWIFHIGHCGSTLLARLLQAWPELQVLREPLPLRSLAAAWPGGPAPVTPLLPRCIQAWSRPLPPASRSLVKATSSCNLLAGDALAQAPAAHAIWLDLALEPWLATLLKSQGSVDDVLVAAPARARLLAAGDAALEARLAALAPHRRCAMSWLAERGRRDALLAGDPARWLHVDFDALLTAPRDTLAAIAKHLQLDPDGVDAALASPWWRRYAKAGQHAYGRDDRAADLRLARERFAPLLDDARRWLDDFLAVHPQTGAGDESRRR